MSEQSDARVPLSVLVSVKNEAANLRDCLASVSFAEEIVVVDSASTDGTQAIAEAAGARVVQFVGDNILSGDNEVHEHVLLNGRVEYLSAPMEHYGFRTLPPSSRSIIDIQPGKRQRPKGCMSEQVKGHFERRLLGTL
jgi:cellulose synthase/poly-beta-1,6-N-acetylglucosamine synthase-like glycosyltransferase